MVARQTLHLFLSLFSSLAFSLHVFTYSDLFIPWIRADRWMKLQLCLSRRNFERVCEPEPPERRVNGRTDGRSAIDWDRILLWEKFRIGSFLSLSANLSVTIAARVVAVDVSQSFAALVIKGRVSSKARKSNKLRYSDYQTCLWKGLWKGISVIIVYLNQDKFKLLTPICLLCRYRKLGLRMYSTCT